MPSLTRLFTFVSAAMLVAGAAAAQNTCPCPPAPPPPPIWTGQASLGLGLTSGNTDTRNFNVAFDIMRDAKKRHVVKAGALYYWSSLSGDETANRLSMQGRDEYRLNDRAFAFGQGQYLRDPFKAIDYLIASTGGFGYKVVATDRVSLSIDGGAGVTWEKNPSLDLRTYGAVIADEQLGYKLSTTATLTHSFSALWKANDFGDALYTTAVGLSAAVTGRTAVKIDLLDMYKSQPPTPDIKKNDVALLVSVAYKF